MAVVPFPRRRRLNLGSRISERIADLHCVERRRPEVTDRQLEAAPVIDLWCVTERDEIVGRESGHVLLLRVHGINVRRGYVRTEAGILRLGRPSPLPIQPERP